MMNYDKPLLLEEINKEMHEVENSKKRILNLLKRAEKYDYSLCNQGSYVVKDHMESVINALVSVRNGI